MNRIEILYPDVFGATCLQNSFQSQTLKIGIESNPVSTGLSGMRKGPHANFPNDKVTITSLVKNDRRTYV